MSSMLVPVFLFKNSIVSLFSAVFINIVQCYVMDLCLRPARSDYKYVQIFIFCIYKFAHLKLIMILDIVYAEKFITALFTPPPAKRTTSEIVLLFLKG